MLWYLDSNSPPLPQFVKTYTNSVYAMVSRLHPPHPLPKVVKKHTKSVYALVCRLHPPHPLPKVVKKHTNSVYALVPRLHPRRLLPLNSRKACIACTLDCIMKGSSLAVTVPFESALHAFFWALGPVLDCFLQPALPHCLACSEATTPTH